MNPQDFIQSHTHAIMLRGGLLSPDNAAVHPEALALSRSSESLIPRLAKFCADKEALTRSASARARSPSAGFSTTDFGNALASVMRVAVHRQLAANMDHTRICSEVNLPNFMPHKIGGARIDTTLLPADELGEFQDASFDDAPGLPAQLGTFGRNIHISRELLLTDDIGLITETIGGFGASAARLEAKTVYELLQSNPTMGDGEPMFDSEVHGNVLPLTFGEVNLSQAMGMLRDRRYEPAAGGEPQNIAAAVLLVSNPLEMLAKNIVHQSGLNLEVIAAPWVLAGDWFLFPDPALVPVIGLLRLSGSKTPVLVDAKRDDLARDGTLLAVRADVGAVPLSRTAIMGVMP